MTSAGIEGGKSLAESAQDLERARKAISVQLAEFDGVKKSLMRDLQNRCEKVRLSLESRSRTMSIINFRWWNWRYSLMKSRNNTITLYAIAIARRSRRRWRSWNVTWNSLRWCRNR